MDAFIYKLGGLLLAILLVLVIGIGVGYWWFVPSLKNDLATVKANQSQHDADLRVIYNEKVKEDAKNYDVARAQWLAVVKRLRDKAAGTAGNPTVANPASGVYGSIPELGLDPSGQLIYAGKPLKDRLSWCARDAALVDAFQNWALRSGIPIK